MDRPDLISRPLVVATGAFVLGVALGLPSSGGAAIASIGLAGAALQRARRRRIGALVLAPAAFFATGMAVVGLRLPPAETLSAALGPHGRDPIVLEGLVRLAPEVGPERSLLVIDLAGAARAVGLPLSPVRGRAQVWIPTPKGPAAASICAGPGDRVRIFAKVAAPPEAESPGAASSKAIAAHKGIALFASTASADACALVARAERGGIVLSMERLRARVHAAIDRRLPAEQASVVRAFATGDRAAIAEPVTLDFTAAGLSHLLAVSGLNLAIIAGLFMVGLLFCFRRVERVSIGPGARRVTAIVALPFVVLYTLLVGSTPSSVRAAVMVLALLLAELFLRPRDAWSSLAAAVLGMLAWDPTTIADVSFQLSFAAVAALLLIYPALTGWLAPDLHSWPWWRRWPFEVVLASAAATLGTAPLVAWHFQRLSLIGLLANVPAAPLSSLILVPLALAGGLIGAVSDLFAEPILRIAGWTSTLLVDLAHLAAEVPYGSIRVARPTPFECAMFYLALVAASIRPARVRVRWIAAALALTLGVEISALEVARRAQSSLRVTFLPVGQGDGAVVELPGGAVFLIDTGPAFAGRTSAERVILPYLRERRIGMIDRVIITHPHADHLGGLAALSAQIEIKELWWTGDRREAPPELFAPMARLKARIVRAGDAAPEHIGPVTIEVLGPIGRAEEHPIVNDGSIVIRLSIGRRAVLLTGDAERQSETEMLARCARCLEADVLKAGHHGSRTSSSDPFLDAVQPSAVIISAGKLNHFGFPHRAVTDRLLRRGVRIWRTDREGAIFVETDGDRLTVRSFASQPS